MKRSEDLKNRIGFHEKFVGREKYFNSAVIVLIVEDCGEDYLLFQKRAQGIRQGGEVCFPGGKIDKTDKNSLETAIRECYEEIGVSENKIEILGKIGTHVIPSGTLVEAYLGKIDKETLQNLVLNEKEVEKCFLVPIKFFLENNPRIEKLQIETLPYYEEDGKRYIFPYEELNLPERYRSPWKSQPREVYFYNYNEELIWGITADIVYELLKYLR
ncbi:MAG: NUDIX hydrolase [Fusobacteriaceae bacterium]